MSRFLCRRKVMIKWEMICSEKKGLALRLVRVGQGQEILHSRGKQGACDNGWGIG